MTVQDICTTFRVGGRYLGCKELTTGNINCTYLVHYKRESEDKYYIVQRINKNVFKNPEQVMDNILRVTSYVREGVVKLNLSTRRFVLRVFCDENGVPFVIDEKGDYWRCYRYIYDSVTYDGTDDLNIIENAGKAFGRFQNCLDGFDASSLYVTIPDFHNTIKRYKDFHAAIEADVCGRVNSVKKEIDDLLSFEEKATDLQRLLDGGEIPLRVTHNDTKCNNVCFDKKTGEALAVLDLDTVMPGAVAHDFGDAVRFIANTTIEDNPDVEKVALDLDKYRAFTKGFVSEVRHSLTQKEKQTMNLGVLTMTVELATRFLTDYLSGDSYFRIKYPGHNLDRARNQIALAKDIVKKNNEMQEIFEEYSME